MNTAFKKRHGWLRDGRNGLICIKAILKYRHGPLPQKSKLSRELAQASRNHEVPWKISMRSQAVSLKKPWISVPNKLRTIKIMEDKKMTQENKSRLIKFLWNLASAVLAAIGTALGVSCAVA